MEDPLREGRKLLAENEEYYVGFEDLEDRLRDSAAAYFANPSARGPSAPISLDPQLIQEAKDPERKWLPIFTTWEDMDDWQTEGPRVLVPLKKLVERASRMPGLAGLVVDPFADDCIQLPTPLLRQLPGRAPRRGPVPEKVEFDDEVPSGAERGPEPEPKDADVLEDLVLEYHNGSGSFDLPTIVRELSPWAKAGGQVILPYQTDEERDGFEDFVEDMYRTSAGPDSYSFIFMYPSILGSAEGGREVSATPVYTNYDFLYDYGHYEHGVPLTFQQVYDVLAGSTSPVEGILINAFSPDPLYLTLREMGDVLQAGTRSRRRTRR